MQALHPRAREAVAGQGVSAGLAFRAEVERLRREVARWPSRLWREWDILRWELAHPGQKMNLAETFGLLYGRVDLGDLMSPENPLLELLRHEPLVEGREFSGGQKIVAPVDPSNVLVWGHPEVGGDADGDGHV